MSTPNIHEQQFVATQTPFIQRHPTLYFWLGMVINTLDYATRLLPPIIYFGTPFLCTLLLPPYIYNHRLFIDDDDDDDNIRGLFITVLFLISILVGAALAPVAETFVARPLQGPIAVWQMWFINKQVETYGWCLSNESGDPSPTPRGVPPESSLADARETAIPSGNAEGRSRHRVQVNGASEAVGVAAPVRQRATTTPPSRNAHIRHQDPPKPKGKQLFYNMKMDPTPVTGHYSRLQGKPEKYGRVTGNSHHLSPEWIPYISGHGRYRIPINQIIPMNIVDVKDTPDSVVTMTERTEYSAVNRNPLPMSVASSGLNETESFQTDKLLAAERLTLPLTTISNLNNSTGLLPPIPLAEPRNALQSSEQSTFSLLSERSESTETKSFQTGELLAPGWLISPSTTTSNLNNSKSLLPPVPLAEPRNPLWPLKQSTSSLLSEQNGSTESESFQTAELLAAEMLISLSTTTSNPNNSTSLLSPVPFAEPQTPLRPLEQSTPSEHSGSIEAESFQTSEPLAPECISPSSTTSNLNASTSRLPPVPIAESQNPLQSLEYRRSSLLSDRSFGSVTREPTGDSAMTAWRSSYLTEWWNAWWLGDQENDDYDTSTDVNPPNEPIDPPDDPDVDSLRRLIEALPPLVIPGGPQPTNVQSINPMWVIPSPPSSPSTSNSGIAQGGAAQSGSSLPSQQIGPQPTNVQSISNSGIAQGGAAQSGSSLPSQQIGPQPTNVQSINPMWIIPSPPSSPSTSNSGTQGGAAQSGSSLPGQQIATPQATVAPSGAQTTTLPRYNNGSSSTDNTAATAAVDSAGLSQTGNSGIHENGAGSVQMVREIPAEDVNMDIPGNAHVQGVEASMHRPVSPAHVQGVEASMHRPVSPAPLQGVMASMHRPVSHGNALGQ